MAYTTVKSWRDSVSEDLGYMKGKMEEMHGDIKKTNGKVINHEERIVTMEIIESNRKAVKKYMAGVWALVGGVVSQAASLAWSVFK